MLARAWLVEMLQLCLLPTRHLSPARPRLLATLAFMEQQEADSLSMAWQVRIICLDPEQGQVCNGSIATRTAHLMGISAVAFSFIVVQVAVQF